MTQKEEKVKTKNCFIIMPFGGWFDSYYQDIYIPAVKNANLNPIRADDLYRPGNIVNDIWAFTKSSDVILADLTNKNPNVFYELGLAHAITKPAILITASIDDVPFDLRSLRIIDYDKNLQNWGEILKEKITKALLETLKNPEDAIPPTFLEITDTQRIKVSPEEKEILEMKKDIEMLKREIRSEKSGVKHNFMSEEDALERIKFFIENGVDAESTATLFKNKYGFDFQWTLNRARELSMEES